VIEFVIDLAGRWFSPVSSSNKTHRHDITEILLKVALNTMNQPFLLLLLYKHPNPCLRISERNMGISVLHVRA
jgi:hypothetical protein